MRLDYPALSGSHVRLEPLTREHAAALAEATAGDHGLYCWSPVPLTLAMARTYVDTALAWREAGTAMPFATVRLEDDAVIGSTRFFDVERWAWPDEHPRRAPHMIDGCEIGYTWLSPSAVRTAANTEAKLLMLTYAFEAREALRVCFHADARNQRSGAALERIGARFEGVLRSHRMAIDGGARDSLRYAITAAEWPQVKLRLENLLRTG